MPFWARSIASITFERASLPPPLPLRVIIFMTIAIFYFSSLFMESSIEFSFLLMLFSFISYLWRICAPSNTVFFSLAKCVCICIVCENVFFVVWSSPVFLFLFPPHPFTSLSYRCRSMCEISPVIYNRRKIIFIHIFHFQLAHIFHISIGR